MNDYSKHVAVIGAGIAGLALGCVLKKEGIKSIIFEKSQTVSNYGAGISISENGINILKKIGVYESVLAESANPKKASFFSKNKLINTFDVNVITTSRKVLYKCLLDYYLSLNGEIIFGYGAEKINIEESEISFLNGTSCKVMHIAACDGIKSICRECLDPIKNLNYSGYSIWRAIHKKSQNNIQTSLGSGHHIVTYPINDNEISFVAAVQSSNTQKSSWKFKGTYEDLQNDLVHSNDKYFSFLESNPNLYKWDIYTRCSPSSLLNSNITLLGDAAHPIVPFLGQGGCLALEDAYIFGKLVARFKHDFKKIQSSYEDIRLKRIKNITKLSQRQGYFNHLSNSFLITGRNAVMKLLPNVAMQSAKSIWTYDADKTLTKFLQ
ncbi:FAD-dependent monooxygenase [Gammaproteobacteria bacterium]|nr:FAD-dependent monooxygenase [Gammaproteobacteria bacterium]